MYIYLSYVYIYIYMYIPDKKDDQRKGLNPGFC